MELSQIVARLKDAVIVLDQHMRVELWLGAAEHILDWSAAEAEGRNINEMLKPRDGNGNPCAIAEFSPPMRRILKAIPEQEVLVNTGRGNERWIGIACTYDRKDRRTIAVARDISRRKTVDLEKSEVISAVSHELRSPLTSVKGFTATLLHKWDRFDDDTKKQLLLTINSDADRVTRLIGELLDISRIESGRLMLRRQMIDLSEIVERVMARVQPGAENHSIRSTLGDGLPEVFADPDKVEQVLTNLLENAVKYTEKGDVIVSGTVEDGRVKVSVSDQGEGIPTDQQAQVFGKFFRRHSRANNPTGTGLGLYISKGLVEAHGGKIWVEDGAAGGAVFSFTLPMSAQA